MCGTAVRMPVSNEPCKPGMVAAGNTGEETAQRRTKRSGIPAGTDCCISLANSPIAAANESCSPELKPVLHTILLDCSLEAHKLAVASSIFKLEALTAPHRKDNIATEFRSSFITDRPLHSSNSLLLTKRPSSP